MAFSVTHPDRILFPEESGEGTAGEEITKGDVVDYYRRVAPVMVPHAQAARIYHPDQLIFDLDPPAGAFDVVRAAAKHLADILDGLGLVPFVKSTGSRGLHVVVPLAGDAGFAEARSFAGEVAALLVAGDPERLTTEVRKTKRGGRVYVDVLRNGYAQTAVAPYSVRALPGAPVAVPLDWDELGRRLDPRRYTIGNVFRRLGRKADPWQDMVTQARPLAPARGRIQPLVRRLAS